MVKTSMLAAKNLKGFTLIELMIAIAVLGILLSIAVPNYIDHLTKARRAEAQSDILQIRLGVEKHRANNNTYSGTLSHSGFTDANDHYNYAVTGANAADPPTATVYVIRATPQGAQATRDSGCNPLTLDQSGNKGPAGCWKK